MKILFAATPLTGHVNPTFAAARALKEAGHTTALYTGSLFREKVEAAGIRFFPLPSDVDYDLRDLDVAFPDLKRHAPGPERSLFNGLAQVILQSTKTPGTIEIEAVQDGWDGGTLKSAKLAITTKQVTLRPSVA